MRYKYLISLFFICALIPGCTNEDIVKFPVIGNKYDPSKPRAITGFTPITGEIGSKFVVNGNFGSDISEMKVIFAGEHEATLISTDGVSIYCIVPKQPGGDNSVAVVVNGETLATAQKFSYFQNRKVSTITGKYKTSAYTDGNIYDARFQSLVGIQVVDGDNIVAVETHNQRVRLISQTENKVITLVSGLCVGKPAVNRARDKMYFIVLYNNQHSVFLLEKSTGWVPRKIREPIPAPFANGEVWSCALDDSEKYLYARNQNGVFMRVNLEEQDSDGQLKWEVLLDIKPNTTVSWNWIVWNTVDKCFFASSQGEHGIYKIWCDESNEWQQEQYAGFSRSGYKDGDRMEAQFNLPTGIAVDSKGDLYIVESYNWLVRKISRVDPVTGAGGIVSTVAGQFRVDTNMDGLPLESTFNDPQDIAVDSEDNFYICEQISKTIRKLAIE
jgi:hypothetical protein